MIRLQTFNPADFERLKSWVDGEPHCSSLPDHSSNPLIARQLHAYSQDLHRHTFTVWVGSPVIGHTEIIRAEYHTA